MLRRHLVHEMFLWGFAVIPQDTSVSWQVRALRLLSIVGREREVCVEKHNLTMTAGLLAAHAVVPDISHLRGSGNA